MKVLTTTELLFTMTSFVTRLLQAHFTYSTHIDKVTQLGSRLLTGPADDLTSQITSQVGRPGTQPAAESWCVASRKICS